MSTTAIPVPSPLSSPVVGQSPPASPIYEDIGDSPLLAEIKARNEGKVVFEAPEPPKSEWVYQVASVVAFIAAFGIAHFTLVVGGFTGARGYAKLEVVQEWLHGLLSETTAQA